MRIRIAAEVDSVKSDHTITFISYGRIDRTGGYTYASANAPDGREKDTERFSALVKALTGREPKVYQKRGGRIIMKRSM